MNRSIYEGVSNPEISAFYDSFSERLLRDYVHGNRRVDAAIHTASSQITRETRRMLDVGCGIGASSFRFRERRDWLTVHGVDISHRNIGIADKLFCADGLVFEQSDMEEVPRLAPYDLITLLDVYEHVPRTKWPGFNNVLAETLSDTGSVVLTSPTPLHQRYLAAEKPEGLQVVDETIEAADILALAESIGATITAYSFVSIWRTNDYLHVVLERTPCFEIFHRTSPRSQRMLGRLIRRLRRTENPVEERRARVLARLGVVVSTL